MIHVDQLASRIEEVVPALAGRFETAARLAALVEAGKAPERTPMAFAMLGALVGGEADMAVGLYRQHFQETVAVVLFERVADDRRGGRAADEITPLVRAVIEAVCGWGPDDSIGGVFTLRLAEFEGFVGGAVVFHIEFALSDQLRIET